MIVARFVFALLAAVNVILIAALPLGLLRGAADKPFEVVVLIGIWLGLLVLTFGAGVVAFVK